MHLVFVSCDIQRKKQLLLALDTLISLAAACHLIQNL